MPFKSKYQKDNDALHLSEDARQNIIHSLEQGEQRITPQRSAWRRAASIAACFAVLALTFLVIWSPQRLQNSTSPSPDASPATQAAAYGDVYAAVSKMANEVTEEIVYDMGPAETVPGASEASQPDMAEYAPSAPEVRDMGGAKESSGEKDFSKTNTQVEGVDEADIVKTDGDYLYILSDNRLIIAQAAGQETKVVSETPLGKQSGEVQRYPIEMFISGSKLVVLFSESEVTSSPPYASSQDMVECMPYYMNGRTIAVTYDISQPAKPEKIAESGQDGDYMTSRMQNDIVYVVTTHYINSKPDEKDPQTFVPSCYVDGKKTPMAPECIILPENPQSTSYVVLTSMSAQTGEQVDKKSLLGYTSTVYMSTDSLIIAQGSYEQELIRTSTEGHYSIKYYRDLQKTRLIRFAVEEGKLTFKAEGAVPGELLDQFSIDEYNGHIRLVTTVNTTEHKVYVDVQSGSVVQDIYDYEGDTQTNALYVLDLDGNIVGKITGLAEDERVYSVRFAGDIGYFVTFRQVDPLFAVDLSNPTQPKILSQLKIPGFSQYLHVYGKGLLFGLGMEADIEDGSTTGMKLSMFDVSDPTDVRELHKLVIKTQYSEALDNHKAILVLPEKGIIAFPTEGGYAVYGYSKDGFVKRGKMEFGDAYSSRGVMIDDLLYVCATNGIGVFELDTFNSICEVGF